MSSILQARKLTRVNTTLRRLCVFSYDEEELAVIHQDQRIARIATKMLIIT
jgi:hypothetical protein